MCSSSSSSLHFPSSPSSSSSSSSSSPTRARARARAQIFGRARLVCTPTLNSLHIPIQQKAQRQKATTVHWRKPQEGWYKLNTDGASKGNPGISGAGGILRDQLRKVIFAFQEPLRIATNSGCCGAHAGTWILANKALRAGYFWPTMEQDVRQLVSKCEMSTTFLYHTSACRTTRHHIVPLSLQIVGYRHCRTFPFSPQPKKVFVGRHRLFH
ncbi:UNVERIFIED_CONTAM: putative ribonuclease H protein [Sesamum radiatum]|uniref:Ribonuclease H protein n=1 Tax=Sesamum radiatum TaxID=300843 RepID=A0AAW2JHD4_SESRA